MVAAPSLGLRYGGTADPVPAVRRRAFSVLTKLAEVCQPEVTQFYDALLPRVFDALGDPVPMIAEHASMALEEMLRVEGFGENFAPEVVVDVVGRLMTLKDRGVPLHCAALSTMAALAESAEDRFLPCFAGVVEHVIAVLSAPTDDVELTIRAVDALGCLATAMSSEQHFMPFAERAAEIAVALLPVDDPGLRGANFLLLGSIAQVRPTVLPSPSHPVRRDHPRPRPRPTPRWCCRARTYCGIPPLV